MTLKKKHLPQFEKRRGYIRDDIAHALERIANEEEGIIDIVPVRQFKHKQGRNYFGIKRVANACVHLGVYLKDGYGLSVNLVYGSAKLVQKGYKGLVDKLRPEHLPLLA